MVLWFLLFSIIGPVAVKGVSESEMTQADWTCNKEKLGDLRIVKELNSQSGVQSYYANEGRLEVCLPGDFDSDTPSAYYWNTVCDDQFASYKEVVDGKEETVENTRAAHAICKTFTEDDYGTRFSTGSAISREKNTKYKIGAADQPHLLDDLDCPEAKGDEAPVDHWWDCTYSLNGTLKFNITNTTEIGVPMSNCQHLEDVMIECKPVLYCYECSGDSYDDCAATNMITKECSKDANACYRKVKVFKTGDISVTHGCMPETNCTSFDTECNSDDENSQCYCNACTTTKCNSLFQIMFADFGSYSIKFGSLVEWWIANFTYLMRIALFDITVFVEIFAGSS